MMLRLHPTNFQRIVVMKALNGAGMGLVGIFIPIYLLESGFSFASVIGWLLVHNVALLIGAFVCVAVSNRIGLVRCWYVRVVLLTLLFAGLVLLPENPQFFLVLAALSGIESAFFWIPYNILMVRNTHRETMGASLALLSNISKGVGIAVPGVAALTIVYAGYPVLFALAGVFIALSLVPVRTLASEATSFSFSLSAMRALIQKNKQFIVPEVIENLGQDAGVLWMLLIFITALTVLDIGALGVLVALAGMTITYVTGQLTDRWSTQSVMRIGAIATTLLWVVSYGIALYAPTPALLYAVTIIRGFALGVFVMAYQTVMFNRARSSDAQFLVLREVPTVAGRIILFLVALACIGSGHFELTFLFVALVSVYFWFVRTDRLMQQDA